MGACSWLEVGEFGNVWNPEFFRVGGASPAAAEGRTVPAGGLTAACSPYEWGTLAQGSSGSVPACQLMIGSGTGEGSNAREELTSARSGRGSDRLAPLVAGIPQKWCTLVVIGRPMGLSLQGMGVLDVVAIVRVRSGLVVGLGEEVDAVRPAEHHAKCAVQDEVGEGATEHAFVVIVVAPLMKPSNVNTATSEHKCDADGGLTLRPGTSITRLCMSAIGKLLEFMNMAEWMRTRSAASEPSRRIETRRGNSPPAMANDLVPTLTVS